MLETAFDPDAYTRNARDGWSQAAPDYDRISGDYFPPIAKQFIAFAKLKSGQSVLDVACGPGLATRLAVDAVGPSGRVVGVDLAPGMIALAKQNIAAATFEEMNAEALSFADNHFDAVICHLGLMLFARPDQALAEIRRVIKPNGTVACLVQGRAEHMLFTGLLNTTLFTHAPQLKTPGAPNLYAFGPEGILEEYFARAQLKSITTQRLSGTFPFASPEEYWKRITAGSGRIKKLLGSLDAAALARIREEVLAKAAHYRSGDKLAIPYEFVMARGNK